MLKRVNDDWWNEPPLRAQLVERFDPNWLYHLPDEAQSKVLAYMGNLVDLEWRSEEMWLVTEGEEPVFFVGILPYSLVGRAKYIWTIPFKRMELRHMKPLAKMVRSQTYRFNCLVAQVVTGYSKGERFARFFGFEPRAEKDGHTVWVMQNDRN